MYLWKIGRFEESLNTRICEKCHIDYHLERNSVFVCDIVITWPSNALHILSSILLMLVINVINMIEQWTWTLNWTDCQNNSRYMLCATAYWLWSHADASKLHRHWCGQQNFPLLPPQQNSKIPKKQQKHQIESKCTEWCEPQFRIKI